MQSWGEYTLRYLSILIFLFFLLVVPVAAAPVMTVTSSVPLIVADGVDNATITVKVTDAMNAVPGADVQLEVTKPWDIQPTTGLTDGSGKFTAKFLPTTKTGRAVIKATVTVAGVPMVGLLDQEIVAVDPQTSENLYNDTATVGTLTEITVIVTDKYGNPVSSKKKNNQVTFMTNLHGDSWLMNLTDKSKVKGLSVLLNESGYAEAGFIVSTKPGTNFISITPPRPLRSALITIEGIADATPATIIQTVTPPAPNKHTPPTLRTDKESRFYINYQLQDQYGNPSTGQGLYISVNTGEQMLITSNNEGNATITYGPKQRAGRYTITATAVNNLSAQVSQVVQFLSFTPTGLVVSANPQTMASRDVDRNGRALVMGKVIDDMGNPVPGETVRFSILSVSNGSAILTEMPRIAGATGSTNLTGVEVSSVTDESGYATVTFTPGAFITDGPQFNPVSSAIVRVRATWGAKSEELTLTFMNYPYLSVTTSVEPNTLETNTSVAVSIRVKGDGYALRPKPVDVIMVTDRSGSMDEGSPSRLDLVKLAASDFVNQFDYAQDRIGQISFGDDTYYSKDVTIDQGLTSDKGKIENAISALQPSGWTPLRLALFNAITELNKSAKAPVRALVILSDGDYNHYGDPLARNSGKGSSSRDPTNNTYYYDCTPYWYRFTTGGYTGSQNMAEYAVKNNIKIFTIGFGDDLSDNGQAALRDIATSAGGKYYWAHSLDDLLAFYTDIAGALKDTAGVNSNLALDFNKVDVTGVTVGRAALNYSYEEGVSTRITRPNGSWYTVNHGNDFNTTGRINVDMGTIKVMEQWVVNFTLKAMVPGNVKVLNSSSVVNFIDSMGSPYSLALPDTYFTSIPEGIDDGLNKPTIDIYGLIAVPSDNMQKAHLTWGIKYENGGDFPIGERVEWRELGLASYRPTVPDWYVDTGSEDGSFDLNIEDFPSGTYQVKVTGWTLDAGSDFDEATFTITRPDTTPQIKIR